MSWTTDPRDVLRVTDAFDLATFDRHGKPGFDGKKSKGKQLTAERGELLAELQERLFAEGRAGGERSLLVVVQGLDTAGKGGVARHVMGMVDPQGVQLRSFGVPTKDEAAHHFLWRIRRALPTPGHIGVFDRSHYEDVLIQRVRQFAPPEEIERRYGAIVDFEQRVQASGTKLIKVMLHISSDEQRERLQERLERPDKHWKYNPGDVDERMLWAEYQRAYEIAIQRTATPEAPWWVIPADKKWYARLVIKHLLLETLESLNLEWPRADFDPEVEMERLAKS